MYTQQHFKYLTEKYGSFASWAIWDAKNEKDTSIIFQSIDKLHSNFVLLGLNISSPLSNKSWVNFHGGRHDRKLKYACHNTVLQGSYITDLFKDIDEPDSSKIKSKLSNSLIHDNVDYFNQEMKDISVNEDTVFIVLGVPSSFLAKCFDTYFKYSFPTNKVIFYPHYSYYKLTDEEWVTGLWDKLGISNYYQKVREEYRAA